MKIIRLLMAAALALTTAQGLHAQGAWPDKPVRIIVPLPPGGPSDIVLRAAIEKMQPILKQPVAIDMTHVPYKGPAPAVQDVMGGQVDCGFLAGPTVLAQVRAGKLVALAVSGAKRSLLLPEVPTMAESGYPGFDATFSLVLFAPKGLPKAIVDTMLKALDEALKHPDVVERLRQSDQTVVADSSDARTVARWLLPETDTVTPQHEGLSTQDPEADMQDPNFILLYVADPLASARFYESLLGKPAVEASPGFAMFVLASGTRLGLWRREAVVPAATGAPGAVELAFAVEGGRPAVDARHAHWQALGLTLLQSPTAMDFGYTFTAQDPDGHRLRVFAPEGA